MPDPVTHAVEEQLCRMLPPGAAVSAARIGAEPPALLAPEQGPADRMHPVRRREFATGRACARLALAALGQRAVALAVGADRAPVWPPGIAGSISHTRELAVAAAAPLCCLTALGIDLEPARPLDTGLWSRVCRPEELRWAGVQRDPGLAATLLFSAKESVFKCLWPQTRVFLEFCELQITPDTRAGTFRVRGCTPALPAGPVDAVRGAWEEVAGHWLTAAWLP